MNDYDMVPMPLLDKRWTSQSEMCSTCLEI